MAPGWSEETSEVLPMGRLRHWSQPVADTDKFDIRTDKRACKSRSATCCPIDRLQRFTLNLLTEHKFTVQSCPWFLTYMPSIQAWHCCMLNLHGFPTPMSYRPCLQAPMAFSTLGPLRTILSNFCLITLVTTLYIGVYLFGLPKKAVLGT